MTAPIDLSHLEQYVFGDRALLDEILTIFIEQAAMWIERMDPALDDEAWHSAAHTLKGASRGVGAWALGDLAEQAEALVGEGKKAARTVSSAALRQSADAAIAFAKDIRDRSA
jgi:HPt (histidine-containing phosphotransfer) domain-containing protein